MNLRPLIAMENTLLTERSLVRAGDLQLELGVLPGHCSRQHTDRCFAIAQTVILLDCDLGKLLFSLIPPDCFTATFRFAFVFFGVIALFV